MSGNFLYFWKILMFVVKEKGAGLGFAASHCVIGANCLVTSDICQIVSSNLSNIIIIIITIIHPPHII